MNNDDFIIDGISKSYSSYIHLITVVLWGKQISIICWSNKLQYKIIDILYSLINFKYQNLQTVVALSSYTGFNPKLLCLAAKCEDIADVDKDINIYVHNFVRQNLSAPEVLSKSYIRSLK